MRSLVAQTILTWGCRYMGVGFGIGLVLPFIIGGTIPLLFISPLSGAIVGAAIGSAGGAYYGWAKSRITTKPPKDDRSLARSAAGGTQPDAETDGSVMRTGDFGVASTAERQAPEGPSALGVALLKFRLVLALSVISALILGVLWLWQTRVRPRILVNSSIVMIHEARFDDAITACREAIRLRPDYAGAYTNLGIALVAQQHRPGEAIAALREAIRLDPGDASAHFALGNALRKSPAFDKPDERKFDEVVREYREAARLDPSSADAPFALGQLLSRLGRLDEAIEAYQRATHAHYVPEEVYSSLYAAEQARDRAAGVISRQ